MKRGRKPRCPYCGAQSSISKGVRKTVSMGNRKLRVCRSCGRKFTVGRKVALVDNQPATVRTSAPAEEPVAIALPVP